MWTMASLTMVLSVAFTGVLVEWIARPKHPRRLFFIALGRYRTAADDARAKRLRIGNAIATATGVGLVLAPAPEWLALTGILVCPLISTVWLVVAASGAARSATLETIPGRFVASLDEAPSWREYVSAPLELANILVVVLPCAVFAWVLERLPETIPAHWNAAGAIDRYGSPSELWMMVGIMLFDLGLLGAIVDGVSKERGALPERETERYAALQMERRRTMVRMLEWLFLAINASTAAIWMGIAFGALLGDEDLVGTVVAVSVAVMLLGCIVPLAVYVPRLVKIADGLREIAGTEVLGTRGAGWKVGGHIYYAPDDPAVFVPKRSGIGQTLNFARPGAWAFLGGIIVLPILISLIGILAAS